MCTQRFFFFIGLSSLCFLFPVQSAGSNENQSDFHPQPMGQTLARERVQLLLYYLPWCPYSQKVLDYLKQIHRSVPTKNLQQDPKGKEELRRIGGKMQVPCLVIDGKAMYESAVIIQWLSQNRAILDPS